MASKHSRVKNQGDGLPATSHTTTCLRDHLTNEKFRHFKGRNLCGKKMSLLLQILDNFAKV